MKGTALCLIAAIVLGIQIPLAKLAYLNGTDPYTFALFRSAIAVPFFLIMARARNRPFAISRRAAIPFALVTISMTAIAFGYLGALDRLQAGLAALLFYLAPIMVVVASAVLARVWPGAMVLVIVAMAFAGLVLVFGPSFDVLDPIGLGLGILAALGATLYFMTVPLLQRHMSAIVTMAWSNLIIAVLYVPIVAGNVNLPDGGMGWFWFIAAAASYSIGLGLAFPAVEQAGSSRAAILFNIEPVAVIALSIPLLGELMTPVQYLGAAIVLVALVLASRQKTPGPAPTVTQREAP